MKLNLRLSTLVALLGLSMLLTACGGGSGNSGSGGASGGTATLDVASDGENLAFAPAELSASAGQQVTVKFANKSTAQQHNWVLVKSSDADAVAQGGLAAGAGANFLPADKAAVIASTPLANGGETQEATFTAPAAGTYAFICTVPGHYPLMQGTLTVK